jgi:APA family basic amino acid/polyamine antiporter
MTARTRLSGFDLACVVVGGIVGVGIFFTPAEVARRVDSLPQLLVAWSLGGLVAALGALVFAELACRLPGHGGTWRYVNAAFGRRTAVLFAWANGFVIQAGALGVIGLVLAEHVDLALHGEETLTPGARVGLAAGAVLLLAALNAAGLRAGKSAQNLFTLAKVVALAGLVALSLLATGSEARDAEGGDPVPTASQPDPGGDTTLESSAGDGPPTTAPERRAPRGWLLALAAAMLPVLFAFGGWQHGTFVAGAARDPMRDVPMGIVGGVAFVVVAYMAVNAALIHVLGLEGARASTAVAADAARLGLERFGLGDLAARVLASAVVVSSVGVLNTICLAPPYVLSSMAEEGLLPARLATRGGAPVVAILVQAGAGVALLLGAFAVQGGQTLDALAFLLDGVVFVDWIFYGLCGVALLRLRRAGRAQGFRAPGGGLVAGLFALFAVAVAAAAVVVSPAASAAGAGACALGLLIPVRTPMAPTGSES